MGKIYTGSAPLSKVYDVTVNAPLDNRTVVRYIADLTTGENGGIAAQVYKGMIVYVQEDNSLYIYTGQSNNRWKTSTGKLVNGGDITNWKKVDSFFLEYYQEKLGSKIFDSTDEFSTIENPFDGQFAYVRDDSEASEDESGLYIYDSGSWTRILTGSGEVIGDFVRREELADYLKKDELPDFLTDSDLDGYVKVEDLAGYLTVEDIADLAKKSDLDDFIKMEDLPDFLTDSDLDDFATKSYIDKKIEDLVGGAPETLDTLKEIAEALEDNATMSKVAEAISTKANSADVYTKDKVYTKTEVDAKIDALPKEGLFPEIDGSEEAEFTPGLATVEGVIDYVADVIEQATPDLTQYATKDELPTKVSELENDVPYLTEHQDLSDYAEKDYVDVAIGGLDIPEHSEVLTTDGTQPTSGSGISVSNDSENAFVEEVYVDDYLHAGVYYTSRGTNSTKDNGGSDDEIDQIKLSNGGDSQIRLFGDGDNWIMLTIRDDSLGFTKSDVTYIEPNGTEQVMSADVLVLPKETPIKFAVDVDFTGMTERRGDFEYTFGEDGATYADIDIYTTNVLPTVNAYVDGVSTRVLTEGDKAEILNKIDENEIEPISTKDIMDLF